MEPMAVDWISGTFFLCKRDVLINIRGFDERFFLYYEDIDLSKRMREAGKEIYYYPEIEINHFQKFPSIYDFGESPYIYFGIHFGLNSALILRYVMIFRTLLRMAMFSSLLLLSGKASFKDKLLTNLRTFKFHLFRGPDVIRRLRKGYLNQPRNA
jgi:GT2 family glycosyltransferase